MRTKITKLYAIGVTPSIVRLRRRSLNMVFQRDGGSLFFYSRGRSWWMVFLRENVSKLFGRTI